VKRGKGKVRKGGRGSGWKIRREREQVEDSVEKV